jgi:hypothetical protein
MGRVMKRLFFEREVDSFAELVEEVGLLDLDSGIRAFVDFEGRRQLLFVTRSPHDSYTLMVYERKAGRGTSVGKRLLVKEFRKENDLTGFMKGILSRPVKAFVY